MATLLRRLAASGSLSWALLAGISVVACASSVGRDPIAATVPSAVTPENPSETRAEEPGGSRPPVLIVLSEGDTPPSGGGLPVASLGLAVTDGNGLLAFTGRLDDNGDPDSFVWRDGSVVWRASDVQGSAPAGLSPLMGSGNAGEFVFQTMVKGLDTLWSHQGLLLQKKQVAPGVGEGSEILLSRWPTMTPDGTAYWVSEFRDAPGVKGKGRALYRSPGATPEAIELVLRSDQLVDGQPISRPFGIDLNYQVSNNREHLVQVLNLVTGSQGDNDVVYLDGRVALREGDAASERDNWKRFSRVAVNDQGDYLVTADTDASSAEDKVIAYNGEIALREGERLDTVSLATQAQVLAITLDNDRRAAHLWSVGGFGLEYLFFACDAARLENSVLLYKSSQIFTLEDGRRFGVKRFSDVGHGPALWLGPGDRIYAEVTLRTVGEPVTEGDEAAPIAEGVFESIIGLALPDCPQIEPAADPAP